MKKPRGLRFSLQLADEAAEPPSRRQIAALLRRALDCGGEVTVRFAAAAESARLNARYRGKDKPADVLAFPYETGGDGYVCGDIVVCFALAARQAAAAGIAPQARCARLIAHGALHLRGHGHDNAAEAAAMRLAEDGVLAALGWQ